MHQKMLSSKNTSKISPDDQAFVLEIIGKIYLDRIYDEKQALSFFKKALKVREEDL